MALPSVDEQLTVELINRIRLDPDGELDRFFSSLNPLQARDPLVQNAIEFFNVNSGALQQNFAALDTVQPLMWLSGLNDAAETHNALMVQFNEQSHQLPGEPGLLERVQDVTTEFFSLVAENVFLFGQTIDESHAAFAIDWGFSPTGIQQPAGHLLAMTEAAFNTVGVSTINYIDLNGQALVSTTHNFGATPDIAPHLVGVIFDDNDGDRFYDAGEGLGGITAAVTGGATTSSFSTGGYQVALTQGPMTVTFSGAGLAAPLSVTLDGGLENRKVDIALTGAENTPVVLIRDDGDFFGIDGTGSSVAPPQIGEIIGTEGPDVTAATDGNDVMRGLGGNDVMTGMAGADVLYGNQQDDVLYGNTGADTLFGGQDADTLFGGRDSDALYGNFQDDALYGNLEADLMFGGQGDDALFGGQGVDTLLGNKGDDALFGNRDNDVLTGGSGADLFYFGLGQGVDVVTDFSGLSGDRVVLTNVLADTAILADVPGALAITIADGSTISLLGSSIATFDPTWLV